MAESMRIPNFVEPSPTDTKFRFHTTENWNPDGAKTVDAVHVVVAGEDTAAFVPNGSSVVRISPMPGGGVTT